jgi:hypothetical protein
LTERYGAGNYNLSDFTGSFLFNTNLLYEVLDYVSNRNYVYSSSILNFSSSYNPSYTTYNSGFGVAGYIGVTQSFYSGSIISSSFLFYSSSATGSFTSYSINETLLVKTGSVGNIFYAQGLTVFTDPYYIGVAIPQLQLQPQHQLLTLRF